MIVINRQKPPRYRLYGPEGFMGMVNEYELLNVRCQIMNQSATGYYIMFEKQKLEFDTNGKLNNWPVGFCDHMEGYYSELIKARIKKFNNE